MEYSHVVRGYGPFDLLLAKLRYKRAIKNLQIHASKDRLLDLGCGSFPLFLVMAPFQEKIGLDRQVTDALIKQARESNIRLIGHDVEKVPLPFDDNYFDAVTLLAVYEHIYPENLVSVHREIHRILKPGGIYQMTTPAVWTDKLLRTLAKMKLITAVEIEDHKGSYNFKMISEVLEKAGFERKQMKFGYFELFMNLWATAIK